MAPRRSPGRSRAKAPADLLLWAVAIAIAGGLAWVWWHSVHPAPEATPPPARPLQTADRPADRPRTSSPPAQTLPQPSPPSQTSPPPQTLGPSPIPPTPTAPPPATVVTTVPPPIVPPPIRPPEADSPLPPQQLEILRAQLALERHGISAGSHDGVIGSQTRAAIRAFQEATGLPVTGHLDAATLSRLDPPSSWAWDYTVTAADLDRLTPVPRTWLGKSSRESLDYETLLERVAEMSHSHPRLVRQLNPGIDWNRVTPETVLRLPQPAPPAGRSKAAYVVIRLEAKILRAYDGQGNLLAHFPCSIARRVEKRPVGLLHVAVLAPNPNYRFDPDLFRDSEEARQIGRPLMIPPGPNNPVGTAWIGLDRPGYGIHGTPNPEDVGRTESLGCFRLANWNAQRLLAMAWVGLPVYVEP
ncbi:MAG: murein L,D-transpeptidase [Verrucomicrobiae bacterium]|nr:murein L,D-transpeptidase [Verrucomicrobiae bacterium]